MIDAPRQSTATEPLPATTQTAIIPVSRPRILILIVALISPRLSRYNNADRLHSALGHITPEEAEEAFNESSELIDDAA